VRLRYFNASGAGFGIGESHDPETHLIPLILQTAKGEQKYISIFGNDYKTKDGTCIRDYIHVLDLADAHYKAIELMDGNDFTTDYFNLGTGKGTSVADVVDICKRVTGIDFEIKQEKRRLGDPDELVADPTKANNILDWKAKYNIENIIKDAWEWNRKR
jgi:UDP-glucose 4-epimerase